MAVLIQSFQDKASHFLQDVVIDGVALTITLDFNTQSGYWQLSITDGSYSLENKKVVANWPLLRQSKALFPVLLGDFILLKTDLEAPDDVTYDSLNNGWSFLYLTELEVEEWEDLNGIR